RALELCQCPRGISRSQEQLAHLQARRDVVADLAGQQQRFGKGARVLVAPQQKFDVLDAQVAAASELLGAPEREERRLVMPDRLFGASRLRFEPRQSQADLGV